MEKLNKVYVVGTVIRAEIEKRDKDGQDYISGKFTVESEGHEIEFKIFSYELTKAGTVSKKYQNYEKISGMIGQRVAVNAEITGRAFYDATKAQVIPFQELNAGFVNLAKDGVEDKRAFEFIGFVTQPLVERLNQENDLMFYEMEVAQANYNEDNLNIVKFRVPAEKTRIASAVAERYVANATISISGLINAEPHTETVTTEVAFGDPIVKVFNSVRKSLEITSGQEPIMDDTAYSEEQITTLQKAYQRYLADLEKQEKDKNAQGKTVVTPQPARTNKIGGLL